MEVRVENRKETDEGSECDGHVRVQRRRIEHDACRERQAHRRPASTTFPRRCRDEDAAPLTHVSLHLCSRRGMREGRSTASTRVLRSLLHSKFLFTLFAFPFSLILLSFTVLTSTWLSYLTSDWSGGIIFDRLMMSMDSRAGRERARGSPPPPSVPLLGRSASLPSTSFSVRVSRLLSSTDCSSGHPPSCASRGGRRSVSASHTHAHKRAAHEEEEKGCWYAFLLRMPRLPRGGVLLARMKTPPYAGGHRDTFWREDGLPMG